MSVDNVRLLGAVVGNKGFADDAELLVELASGSPRDTRRGLDSWLAMVDYAGEAEREESLRLKRHVTFTPNGEGMYDVKGVLMPEDVAHIETAWAISPVPRTPIRPAGRITPGSPTRSSNSVRRTTPAPSPADGNAPK